MTDPLIPLPSAPESQPESNVEPTATNPSAPYGYKKDGTPKKAPGKKKGAVKVMQSGQVENDPPEKPLSPYQQAELEAQKQEQQFQEELAEILKESAKYDGFPDLQLNQMLMNPKAIKSLFTSLFKKVKQGDVKILIRYLDQIVGKPRQQVELVQAQNSNVKEVVKQLSIEEMVALAKQAVNQQALPVQTQPQKEVINVEDK